MKSEDVKIIYCYDENKNPIHYSKTVKGNIYTCIDCDQELIVKQGNIKVKHLAHKNTEHCGGTGESIFHKHWKENLFKAGMFIDIAFKNKPSEPVEILDVFNEVSLSKFYNKEWDKEIIVDVLLITNKGEIVVEINYKNKKNWGELITYYNELDLLRVYELTVNKTINTPLKWNCVTEYLNKNSNYNKELEEFIKDDYHIQFLFDPNGTRIYKFEVYFNFKNELNKINNDNYNLVCLSHSNQRYRYKIVNLKFNLKLLGITEDELIKNFTAKSGIKKCTILYEDNNFKDNYNVVKFDKSETKTYDKQLYAKLCKINDLDTTVFGARGSILI
jgi:hypothetical protein